MHVQYYIMHIATTHMYTTNYTHSPYACTHICIIGIHCTMYTETQKMHYKLVHAHTHADAARSWAGTHGYRHCTCKLSW